MKQRDYNKSSSKTLSTSHQEKDKYKDNTTTKEASFDNFIRRENFTIKRKRKHKLAKKGFSCEDKRNSLTAPSSSAYQQCKEKAPHHWWQRFTCQHVLRDTYPETTLNTKNRVSPLSGHVKKKNPTKGKSHWYSKIENGNNQLRSQDIAFSLSLLTR